MEPIKPNIKIKLTRSLRKTENCQTLFPTLLSTRKNLNVLKWLLFTKVAFLLFVYFLLLILLQISTIYLSPSVCIHTPTHTQIIELRTPWKQSCPEALPNYSLYKQETNMSLFSSRWHENLKLRITEDWNGHLRIVTSLRFSPKSPAALISSPNLDVSG